MALRIEPWLNKQKDQCFSKKYLLRRNMHSLQPHRTQGGRMLKSLALLAVWAGMLAVAAPAQAIDVISGAGVAQAIAADVASPTLPVGPLSELPEPEVFAMMLLGLVLIGYRASRDSDEKFT
jgi:hypothetical protein